mgnify:CR=1 FL=1
MESTIDDLKLTELIENDYITLQYSKNDIHSNISKETTNYDDNLKMLSRIAQTELKEGDIATALDIVSEMYKFRSLTTSNCKKKMIVQCEQAITDVDKIIKTNTDKQLN